MKIIGPQHPSRTEAAAWREAVKRWPPWLREAHRARYEQLRRLGVGTIDQCGRWAFMAYESLGRSHTG